MEKVLIIMSTYNGDKYLEEQLESILRQKSVRVELLIRDDGSSDSTQKILEQYKEKSKLCWYTGAHLDVAKSYFDLLKASKAYDAKYIAFADQDDVWDENKLVIAVENLKSLPSDNPQLYYCGQRLVDSDLQFLSNHKLNKERTLKTRFVLSDFAGCTGVFNIKLRDAVIKYEPSYMLMHDTWILKICLALGGDVVVDPEPHMSYRQHGGNTVGLGRSMSAYLKQVKQYMNEYLVEPQMEELLKGYGDGIVPDYKELAECICSYKHDSFCKRKLLNSNIIDFHNRGLNLTYKLKVILNKL